MKHDLRDDTRLAGVTLLNAKQLAALIGCHSRHVWRLQSAGELPKPLRIGERCVRWRLCDVEKWINDKAQ